MLRRGAKAAARIPPVGLHFLPRSKMPLQDSIKEKIRNAIRAREPVRTKSGDYLLRFGNARNSGYRYLVRNSVATEAGDYWAEQTNQPLPIEGFDPNQAPVRRGRTFYIETTKGQQVVRTWDPVRNRFKYTALGRKFYKDRRSEWVAIMCPSLSAARG